ncbi:MAG: YfhO family protein [Butyrivibrio sp.]|nr:YfhO family protein [Butyrivibrio sp.]
MPFPGEKSIGKSESGRTKAYYVPAVMFGSSFVMYLISLLPIFIKRGLPFFYYGDYNVQQIPFYTLAHRAVRAGDFYWNWNLDLGGSLSGDLSFYLLGSPFFWLTVPFPEEAIPYLMPVLMALKYAVAATCAYLYISRYVHKYIYGMIGGYLYAFSGFNACNIVFNHFTDIVAFFPLYLLLFERLMDAETKREEKLLPSGWPFVCFSLMTAFMAIVNYYFFFGQVLFLILYFFIRYAKEGNLRDGLIRFNRALFSGILGTVLAGFFFIPAVAGVSGNSRLSDFVTGYNMLVYPSGKLVWDIFKSLAMLPDIIGKGTLFFTSTVKFSSLAAYIPMYGISGVVAFFLLGKKKRSWQKTLLCTCLIIAVIPVYNSAFSLFNSSYYARWFYMPVLIMCLVTAMAAERGKSEQMKKGAIAAVFFFLLFVAVYLLPSTNNEGKIVFFNMSDNNELFLWDMGGTAVLCIMLLITAFVLPKKIFVHRGQVRNLRDALVLFLVICSCIITTFIPVRNGSSIISDRGKQKWQEQMLEGRVDVDLTGFARGEVDSTSTNYDIVWSVPSIHCFLSTVPSEIFDFLEGTANIERTVETNIPEDRAGLRAILSGRYYFENADISKDRIFNNGEGTPGYYYLDTRNGFDIFENRNYIPMGFCFDHYITESEWEDLDPETFDLDLVRALILPDEVALEIGDSIAMDELFAEDIIVGGLSYDDFVDECTKRRNTACTEFLPDTNGFLARTAEIRDDTLVFFSVPARKGFSCKVDGSPVPIYKADYGLMAIPVKGGAAHEIRVDYELEGKKIGNVLSLIGLLILAGYIVYIKKYQSNQ